MIPEIDKLRQMLTEADIPFESIQQKRLLTFGDDTEYALECMYGMAAKWDRNQVIYGHDSTGAHWRLDGIWQKGSYGAKKGMIETYGPLGTYKREPRVLTAEEVFQLIQTDWNGLKDETKQKYRERAQKKQDFWNKLEETL